MGDTMHNTIGTKYRLTIFGASHAEEIGVNICGLPVGFTIDKDELLAFMARRAPGQGPHTTTRKEADEVIFTEGVADDGTILAGRVTAIIKNTNVRRQDYESLRDIPRPGHADLTARQRYGEDIDMSGGGAFSGRMTAPLCIAGGIALQILATLEITVEAKAEMIGGETDPERMDAAIEQAAADGDSVGGIIACAADGVPAGFGDPMFDGIENRIARIVFGIPAVKGIEFGAGFAAAAMRGSEHNDAFYYEDGQVRTRSNSSGGILGGITAGMPLTFRAAIKPTPSIGKEQESINTRTGEPAKLNIEGRHDPCIVPRAVPVIEAACACALLDVIIEDSSKA